MVEPAKKPTIAKGIAKMVWLNFMSEKKFFMQRKDAAAFGRLSGFGAIIQAGQGDKNLKHYVKDQLAPDLENWQHPYLCRAGFNWNRLFNQPPHCN